MIDNATPEVRLIGRCGTLRKSVVLEMMRLRTSTPMVLKPLALKYVALAIFAVLMVPTSTAEADDLVIGIADEASSMDPHFSAAANNVQIARHIYDSLVQVGPDGDLLPALALSWGPTEDPLVWEFELRRGVTFHDGSPFTAADVAFSLRRAGEVPNSPASFSIFTAGINRVEVVGDHTVRIHTETPDPMIADKLAIVAIVSQTRGESATTEQYNSGEVAVGTGPYRQVSFVRGDRIELEGNQDYWGTGPNWDRVTFIPISAPSSRMAALLSGSVDIVEGVPTECSDRLSTNPNITLSTGISNRLIYLHLDSDRAQTPMITAIGGGDIVNPLRDSRVREALSIAIDRDAIVENVMESMAVPAGQFLPDGGFGVSDRIAVPEYDPDRARALLEEAGFGDGFAVTLHGPNDRFVNDARVLQAVAQMFSRIGLDVEVEALPSAVYYSRVADLEYSITLSGWGSLTGETSTPLRSLIATYSPEDGWGTFNRGRYSNHSFDALLEQALQTIDDDERHALLARATEIAMNDTAIIPLHFQVNMWGSRPDLGYVPRRDDHTLADGVFSWER